LSFLLEKKNRHTGILFIFCLRRIANSASSAGLHAVIHELDDDNDFESELSTITNRKAAISEDGHNNNTNNQAYQNSERVLRYNTRENSSRLPVSQLPENWIILFLLSTD